MSTLRRLKFETLDEATQEAIRLLESGYVRSGNWSLGQICRHLTLVQDPSIDGYPFWLSLFAPLRPVMRWWLLPKLLDIESQPRIRTIKAFMPPADSDDSDDTFEVHNFRRSVDRMLDHTAPFAPHPAFGRVPRQTILQIHAAHAAHHLRFLQAQ